MFDWNDLRYFLELSRLGRLHEAAQRLHVDHTTVSRRLAALEKALGARLFDKSPKGHALTEAGERLLAHAERMEAQSISLYHDLSGEDTELTGTVRLATPEAFGTQFLARHLPEFRARHPRIDLELVSETRRTSLSKREADLAVTLGRPESGRLVGWKMTDYRLQLYASPAYLARSAPIQSAADLKDHDFIGYIDDLLALPELRVLSTLVRNPRVVFRSTSIQAQERAAASGLGLALLHGFACRDDPDLVPVLADEITVMRQYWLLVHEDLRNTARVDAVCRFVTEIVHRHQALFVARG